MYKAESREIHLGHHKPDRVAHDPVVVHLVKYEIPGDPPSVGATATIVWVEEDSNGELSTKVETLHTDSWSKAAGGAMDYVERHFGGFEKPAPANRDKWI